MNERKADTLKETMMLESDDGVQYKYEIYLDTQKRFYAQISRLDKLNGPERGLFIWCVIQRRLSFSRQATLISWATGDALAHFEQHFAHS